MISNYSSEKSPQDLIKDTWRIIGVGDSSVLELRAIRPKGHQLEHKSIPKLFRRTDYDTEQDLKQAVNTWALSQNDFGYNIYVVMNSIKSSHSTGSVSNSDIEFRDLLFIDLDRATDTKNPATDQEIDAAFEVADNISRFFQGRGMDSPIQVMSGNGVHLYFILDSIANDERSTNQIKKLLCLVGRNFDTPKIKVDRGVYDSCRITKVPGTVMRKGVEQPDQSRVFRRAYVCDDN